MGGHEVILVDSHWIPITHTQRWNIRYKDNFER